MFASNQDSFPTYSTAVSINPYLNCPTGNVFITGTLSDNCNIDPQVNIVEAYFDAGNDGTDQTSSFDLIVTANLVETDDVVTFTHPALPQGTHRLRLIARDGCGNLVVEDHIFTIYDAKAPSPVCIQGLAAELIPLEGGTAGMAVVNAVDFVINSPIPDCSGEVSAFQITRVTSDLATILASEDLAASLTLNCTDKGQLTVAVVATDAAGNSDYCLTTIAVQDNLTPCFKGGEIDCTSEDISIPEVSLNSQTLAAKNSIVSRSSIQNDNKVNFFAGESITLRPGFTVEAGAEFSASIQECVPSSLPVPQEFNTELEEEFRLENTINVYPNPFNSSINVEVQEASTSAQISIYSIQGMLIRTFNKTELNGITMDLGFLEAGVYVLKVVGNDFVNSRRIVKSY